MYRFLDTESDFRQLVFRGGFVNVAETFQDKAFTIQYQQVKRFTHVIQSKI
jgi:hypothetical protein